MHETKTKVRPPIRRGESYTVSQFLLRTGMARGAFRLCERRGLQSVRIGQRKFVTGDAWFDYIESQSSCQPAECV